MTMFRSPEIETSRFSLNASFEKDLSTTDDMSEGSWEIGIFYLPAAYAMQVPGSERRNSSSIGNMSRRRTFNSIVMEESQCFFYETEDNLLNNIAPIAQGKEQDKKDFLEARKFTFSKNVHFVNGLVNEATGNMLKNVTVMREEPSTNIVKAIVQSRFDCLRRNVGAIKNSIFAPSA